jgi:Protein O-mannosyl-transferase TMEM260-like
VTSTDPHRPPYGAAALATLGILAIYLLTLAPTTAFWDTSEYIATAQILGIPHPPGNPLFVVLARSWIVLLSLSGLPVAVRVNLLAAVTSAASSGFFFLIAHRVLSGLSENRRFALLGAGAAALLGGTAFTVWNQSTVNEKVYTISMFVIAAVSWLCVRWRDRRHEPGSERYLLAAFFLMALGSTNHMMSVLPAPAVLLFVMVSDVSIAWRKAFLVRVIPLAILGLSFNFVLPVRAALDPVINEGDPVCESVLDAARAIYTNGKTGCPMLADNLTRKQYQTPPVTQRKAPFPAQMAMYMQYFDWQWSRGLDPSEQPGGPRRLLTLLFGALGLLGLWAAWRADRAIFAYLAVLAGTLSVALVVYLNFRYGYSLAPEIADRAQHEVRERDYFYVASFLLWGALAGLGLAWLWHTLAELVGGARRYAVASPVLVLAFIPLILNWNWASRAGDYAARDWAYDLLMSVEPYGVLFTNGDNDTFPLWYVQEVEGLRQDVTVIVGQYLFTTWYPKQLQEITRPERQRRFDPELVPGLYADAPLPSKSIVALEPEQMDRIGNAVLSEDLNITFPQLVVTYPKDMRLNRGHQLALSVIHDAIGERPIFFASIGGLMRELGMDRWGVRHGLAVKLELRSLERERPESWVQGTPEFGGYWFDFDQSMRLYDDVYSFRGIRGRPIWQDRSTLNIPWQYYALALQLADVGRTRGVEEGVVRRLEEDALDFQSVAQGGVRGKPRTETIR